ncbi:MAG: bacteriochlorophyll 4-vinyl reductase [Oscillochloris sp.]|nr:bacteriochlorophyll 4-vinyl reductase [Oscillochloris sp.]
MSTVQLEHVIAPARIGPNSLIQTVAALAEARGWPETEAFLARHGRIDLLQTPPSTMVDEAEFIAMIGWLRSWLGVEATRAILAESGRRTAEYVRANRIPAPVRTLLAILPRNLALRLLLRAIAGHSWTFAGSAHFSYRFGKPTTLSLAGCPECCTQHAAKPICSYYTAAFTTLLTTLVDHRIQVVEIACTAQGASSCTFELRF